MFGDKAEHRTARFPVQTPGRMSASLPTRPHAGADTKGPLRVDSGGLIVVTGTSVIGAQSSSDQFLLNDR